MGPKFLDVEHSRWTVSAQFYDIGQMKDIRYLSGGDYVYSCYSTVVRLENVLSRRKESSNAGSSLIVFQIIIVVAYGWIVAQEE